MMEYTELKRDLRMKVQERMDYEKDLSDQEVEDTIDEVLLGQENLVTYPVEVRRRLKRELFDSLRRLDILQKYVDDSSVTEIMINGKDHIFVEQDGRLPNGSGVNIVMNPVVLNGPIVTIRRFPDKPVTMELQLQKLPNLARLETWNSNAEGCREITVRELIRPSLRMRPDRIKKTDGAIWKG